ncbi:hypothetical protein RvY_03469-2 [Ramazzottius varieornatus]|uniref:Uncharacterized protein n=1 Tax=Ramazzottius varieornatus TaxID=947166 RepID=A0A1D1UV80_RAMVA|nr:hypothetical protein RvY_03469-2 [Ramazzottius varieornatus]
MSVQLLFHLALSLLILSAFSRVLAFPLYRKASLNIAPLYAANILPLYIPQQTDIDSHRHRRFQHRRSRRHALQNSFIMLLFEEAKSTTKVSEQQMEAKLRDLASRWVKPIRVG